MSDHGNPKLLANAGDVVGEPAATASSNEHPVISVGTVIDNRYEFGEVVGQGGWATVYKAQHCQLKHLCAIKVLHQHLAANSHSRQRFNREIDALRQLSHPNIARVLDCGDLPEGQPYIVMEFLQGVPLNKRLESGPLPIWDVIAVCSQICEALEVAHGIQIFHRDINPGNIMLLEENGRLNSKLLDFGLAKIAEENFSSSLTQTGSTIGTPACMSPEQCKGHPADARSDIYSLGCVLYRAVTGHYPFSASNLYDMMNHHVKALPGFEKSMQRIPMQLQLLILKCMAKAPEDRFQTAAELNAALRAIRVNFSSPLQAALQYPQQFTRVLGHKLELYGIRSTSLQALGSFVLLIACLVFVQQMINRDLTKQIDQPPKAGDTYKLNLVAGREDLDHEHWQSAISHFQGSLRAVPASAEGNSDRLQVWRLLKNAYTGAGMRKEAEATDNLIADLLERFPTLEFGDETTNANRIAALEKQLGTSADAQLVALRNKQAELMLLNGRTEEAELQLNRALPVLERSIGSDDPIRAVQYSNMACMLASSGKPKEAEEKYIASLQIRRRLFGENNPYTAKSLRNLGDFYLKVGNLPEAQRCLNDALSTYSKLNKQADVAWVNNNLGIVYLAEKRYPESRTHLTKALALRTQLYGTDSLEAARTLHNLAVLDARQGKLAVAIDECKRAYKIFQLEQQPSNAETIDCGRSLICLYRAAGQTENAETVNNRINEVLYDAGTNPKKRW